MPNTPQGDLGAARHQKNNTVQRRQSRACVIYDAVMIHDARTFHNNYSIFVYSRSYDISFSNNFTHVFLFVK